MYVLQNPRRKEEQFSSCHAVSVSLPLMTGGPVTLLYFWMFTLFLVLFFIWIWLVWRPVTLLCFWMFRRFITLLLVLFCVWNWLLLLILFYVWIWLVGIANIICFTLLLLVIFFDWIAIPSKILSWWLVGTVTIIWFTLLLLVAFMVALPCYLLVYCSS